MCPGWPCWPCTAPQAADSPRLPHLLMPGQRHLSPASLLQSPAGHLFVGAFPTPQPGPQRLTGPGGGLATGPRSPPRCPRQSFLALASDGHRKAGPCGHPEPCSAQQGRRPPDLTPLLSRAPGSPPHPQAFPHRTCQPRPPAPSALPQGQLGWASHALWGPGLSRPPAGPGQPPPGPPSSPRPSTAPAPGSPAGWGLPAQALLRQLGCCSPFTPGPCGQRQLQPRPKLAPAGA